MFLGFDRTSNSINHDRYTQLRYQKSSLFCKSTVCILFREGCFINLCDTGFGRGIMFLFPCRIICINTMINIASLSLYWHFKFTDWRECWQWVCLELCIRLHREFIKLQLTKDSYLITSDYIKFLGKFSSQILISVTFVPICLFVFHSFIHISNLLWFWFHSWSIHSPYFLLQSSWWFQIFPATAFDSISLDYICNLAFTRNHIARKNDFLRGFLELKLNMMIDISMHVRAWMDDEWYSIVINHEKAQFGAARVVNSQE